MKSWLIAIGLMFASVSVKAESISTATYLNVPFKSVNVVGSSERSLHFKYVSIGRKWMSVSVDLDYVEIALVKEDNPGDATTLDVLEAKSDLDWLMAKRVIVSVRSQEDFLLWNKFLQRARESREYWRKRLHQPSRVFPTKDPSP